MVKNILLAMRIEQWTKNLFIFAPLIFAKHLNNIDEVILVFFSFICFSVLSSGNYILNDILDIKNDVLHPSKKNRVITSKKISIQFAVFLSLFFIFLSTVFSFLINKNFFLTVIAYLFVGFLYSFIVKKIVILDVIFIAIGFVLRVIAGAVVINISVSEWILVCTFLISLFLGFVKRRTEIITLENNAQQHRLVLENYNIEFLNLLIAISTATSFIAYIFYTMSNETIEKFHTKKLIFTVPFVLFGIFRYLYLSYKKNIGDDASKILFFDFQFLINILLWFLMILYFIYI